MEEKSILFKCMFYEKTRLFVIFKCTQKPHLWFRWAFRLYILMTQRDLLLLIFFLPCTDIFMFQFVGPGLQQMIF
jgi:hypothetical protein